MTTAADYIGRTYDVMSLQGVVLGQSGPLIQALALPDIPGAICTGIQKLTQWFVLELLTDRGSIPYAPLRGTDFMPGFRQGHYHNENDVFMAFSLATGQIQTTLQSQQRATDPLDEQFQNAELVQLTFLPGILQLTIDITSAAGTSRAAILPIATTP